MSGNISRLLVIIILLCGSIVRLPGQEANSSTTQSSISVAKLLPPVYPTVAKQAHVSGDVRLTLVVRGDGSVESATVVSGHPLLKQAALDSAQHSQFACDDCEKGPRSFEMTYSFELGPTVYCTESSGPPKADKENESYPRVVQVHNQITLYDRPVGTCDLAFKITERKVRSIKCLYLWKCGLADWHEEPLNAPHSHQSPD